MEFTSLKELDFTPRGAVYPSPTDWREQFIYFLMVDRFHNNELEIPEYNPETAQRGRDLEVGKKFQGGKIKGVTSHLDYIKNLGATTIWISPVIKNRQDNPYDYHGYAPQDYLSIDPRFGSLRDLQELVRQAHDRDMCVIVDIVVNHTGDNWAYEGDGPRPYKGDGQYPFGHWRRMETQEGEPFGKNDAVWPVEFQNPDWYKRRGEIGDWNNLEEAQSGDFLSLKTLDHSREDVVNALTDVYKYWIAAADFDGYRIDAVKHVEDTSVALCCNALREYALSIGKENFFLFGEVVGDDDVIERYLGRTAMVGGPMEPLKSLDACLDFPQYFILEDVFKGFTPPTALIERFEKLSSSYADHGEAAYYFVTFVDNHDQMIRPYRRFLYDNPYPEQAALVIGYLLTAKGIPCIYYGTEQGFDGGGDCDCYIRECMFGGNWGAFDTLGQHFFNDQHPIYRSIKRVSDIRAVEPALKFGRMYFREISGDGVHFGRYWGSDTTLAYARVLADDEIIIALNLSTKPREDHVLLDVKLTPPDATLIDLIGERKLEAQPTPDGGACVKIPLGGHEMALIKRLPPEESPQPVALHENG